MIDEKIKNDITVIIRKSPIPNDLEHAEATLKWLLYIKPDADSALQVAAFAHDIDRGVNKLTEKDRPKEIPYNLYKEQHAKRSSEIIANLLRRRGYGEAYIQKVKNLVENHEVGGDEEAEILQDADSIAYFDLNIPIYLSRNGEEATRHKIRFMFDRASERAQKIIKKMRFKDSLIQKLVNEEVVG